MSLQVANDARRTMTVKSRRVAYCRAGTPILWYSAMERGKLLTNTFLFILRLESGGHASPSGLVLVLVVC